MRANTRHILGMLMLASQADIVSGLHWYQRAYDLGVKLIHEYDGLTMGQAYWCHCSTIT
jgi:metal-dependent hydrolase (beta-lactamase superfamily II)